MKCSASPHRIGVGPAEPMQAVARVAGRGQIESASEQTAITIALRVPILANCCGPSAAAMWNAAISSSSARQLRFGPVTNSPTGIRRVPAVDASSTSASDANSGGSASPAGDEVPRLPPTVPRLRICGEPTVREAIASPGRRSPSSAISRV